VIKIRGKGAVKREGTKISSTKRNVVTSLNLVRFDESASGGEGGSQHEGVGSF